MDQDALSGARLSDSLYVKDFPVKLRVLTLDPMVYRDDKYGSTHYVFIVFNIDEQRPQVLDKGPGFAQKFQEIHMDADYGNNLRGIDVKIKTNGASGKDIRYDINTVGMPYELSQEALIKIRDAKINLDEIVKKRAANALRLSAINAGQKVGSIDGVEDMAGGDEGITIEDIGDEPVNLDSIPF